MPDPWQEAGFGLYVHWPFCQSKCPYCDFNSHVVPQVDQARWRDALCREIRRYADLTPGRVLRSVFFGGGTPSLMTVDTVSAVLDATRGAWTAANDIEITLEANPSSVEAERFAGYRAAGVNRISIGVQALNDPDLRRLGRLHSVSEAERAIALARDTFDRVSLDLIYARQDQTPEAWAAELDRALGFGLDHYALYQLTIEDGTVFRDRLLRGQLRGLPDEDRAVALWDITQERCAAAGLPAYEVSNHAQPGAESRHNMIYWQSGDWAGVGPGAHGRLTLDGQRIATAAERAPGKWLAAVEAGADPASRDRLGPSERRDELVMMALRTGAGLSLARLEQDSAGLPPLRTEPLIEAGLIEITGDRLRTTAAGRVLLNAVLAELLPD